MSSLRARSAKAFALHPGASLRGSRSNRGSAIEDRTDEIAELHRREVFAFDRRRETAVAIDDGGLQRVRDQPFLRPVLNPECVADALDVLRIAGEEMPARSAGAL